MRSSLDGFKQASSNALSKAQLMVGGGGAVEMSSSPTNNSDGGGVDGEIPTTRTSSFRGLFGGRSGEADEASQDNSEQSSNFVADAADMLCPELTFQQRLIGFAVCFGIACECAGAVRNRKKELFGEIPLVLCVHGDKRAWTTRPYRFSILDGR